MSVITEWLDENKTIIRLYYEKKWDWQDAIDAHVEANRLMNSVAHFVAVIIDMSATNYMPPQSIFKVRELSYMRGQSPNDSGITVFLDADVLTKAVVNFIETTDAQDLPELTALFARSMDDAIAQAKKELAELNNR